MFLRKALSLTLAAFAFAAAGAWAAPYGKLDTPQPTEKGKVEVIEFFWYGCPHCYAMEPAVAEWLKTKPADVTFKRIPGIAGGWVTLGEVFYTLDAMGKGEALHSKVFDAIHKQHVNLNNRKVLGEWLGSQGVDWNEYQKVEKSFSVITNMNRAKDLTTRYQVDSVPRFIIGGKYFTSGEQAGGNDKVMAAVDEAIAAVRKEK